MIAVHYIYLTGKGIALAPEVRVAGPDAKISVERKRDDSASEPWMMQQGGIDKLDGPLRESAERSYAKWAEGNPELGRKYSLSNYVSYVQDKWADEDRKAERAELADISIAGRLLVPMRNIDGDLRSLQIIDDKGQKMFARGGEAVGSHLVLGNAKSAWPLHFCEGYATGKAIHKATGHAVVVTFSAYNLAPVAAAYRERYPERTLFIDADNDHRKARERDSQDRQKKNTGKERAESAAKLVDGYVLLPPFSEKDAGKDWDDYQRQHGKEALAIELTNQIASASRMKIAKEIEAARSYGRSTLERTPARVR